jgi:predicted nucleic acid-binding protein
MKRAKSSAARTYYDLRRLGRTVRSAIDCCIAQAAIDHQALLLHRDRDFDTIAQIRPLRQVRMEW